MFPLRRRTTVVGERGHRLARRHVRVLVRRAVPGAASRRHLGGTTGPGRAVLVTCPAVPRAAVVGGGVARAVVTGPGVVTVTVSGTLVARIAVASTVIAGLVVPGTVVARLVIAGPVVAGLVVAGRRALVVARSRALVVAALGVPAW